MTADEITYEKISQLLRYDAETGRLYWLPRPREMFSSDRSCKTWNSRFAGQEAFTSIHDGQYKRGRLLGLGLSAHRMAWLLHYKSLPVHEIDDIDGNGLNNAILNLRDVPHATNMRNQRKRRSRQGAATGVHRVKRTGKWIAYVGLNMKLMHLGTFDTLDAACAARQQAQLAAGFHQNHGRR